MISIIKNKYLLWMLLAFPSWVYFEEFLWSNHYYPEMMERSGILSVQLLVFTLCITPLSMILRLAEHTKPVALWLVRNRRYFGVAGFAYAAIHTILYARYTYDLELIWLEAWDWAFGFGWISLLILVPLAMTSNNWSVRKMGANWKTLQRLSYLAIIAGLAHWILLDIFIENPLVWVAVLVVAKTIHIAFRAWTNRTKAQTKAATA